MKKLIALFLSLLLALSFMACSNQANQNADGARQEDTQNSLSGKENLNASDTLNSVPEDTGVADEVLGQLESIQIKMTFDGKEAVITLLQNPTSQSLLDMLPLDLTFEDYAGSEKISYLPDVYKRQL